VISRILFRESDSRETRRHISIIIGPGTGPLCQGRPARVEHDAQMHHGQNRGSKKRKWSDRTV